MATRTVTVTSKTGKKYGPYTYSKGGGGGGGAGGSKKGKPKPKPKTAPFEKMKSATDKAARSKAYKKARKQKKADLDKEARSKAYKKARKQKKADLDKESKARAEKAKASGTTNISAGAKDLLARGYTKAEVKAVLPDTVFHHDKYSNTSKAEVSFVKEKKACGY